MPKNFMLSMEAVRINCDKDVDVDENFKFYWMRNTKRNVLVYRDTGGGYTSYTQSPPNSVVDAIEFEKFVVNYAGEVWEHNAQV